MGRIEHIRHTKTAHHIQPIFHSIHEQNPGEEQLEQEGRALIQTLMLLLHLYTKKKRISI